MKYVVHTNGLGWGILPEYFDEYLDADNAGQNWVMEMEDLHPENGVIYSYEVVEEED